MEVVLRKSSQWPLAHRNRIRSRTFTGSTFTRCMAPPQTGHFTSSFVISSYSCTRHADEREIGGGQLQASRTEELLGPARKRNREFLQIVVPPLTRHLTRAAVLAFLDRKCCLGLRRAPA